MGTYILGTHATQVLVGDDIAIEPRNKLGAFGALASMWAYSSWLLAGRRHGQDEGGARQVCQHGGVWWLGLQQHQLLCKASGDLCQ